jgi:hypothetical protein
LTLQQINKVARYALSSTMALAHYNPINFNIKALSLLIMKETDTSTGVKENVINSSEFKDEKEYLDFFDKDEEI